jgi:hypothetical protein
MASSIKFLNFDSESPAELVLLAYRLAGGGMGVRVVNQQGDECKDDLFTFSEEGILIVKQNFEKYGFKVQTHD